MATVQQIIDAAVDFAVRMANDNKHGYSQAVRSLYNIDNPTSFDCSSLACTAYYYAFKKYGITPTPKDCGCTYTGNMLNLLNCGFEVVATNQTAHAQMQKGDIELNTTYHTAIAIDGNNIVHARSSEGTSDTVDGSGNEIRTQPWYLYSHGWTHRLRFTGKGLNLGGSGKSVDDIAREVIAGNWGTGADRVNRLKAAGYNAEAVQARVNEMMGAGSKEQATPPAQSSHKYHIGQHVVFSTCYKSSTAPITEHLDASQMARNHGVITKIAEGAGNPYLLDNGLCWVNDGDIRGFYTESYTVQVTANSGLNIRSGAGTGYNIVGALTKGTKVTVTQTSGSWGKISQGWICLDHTKRV